MVATQLSTLLDRASPVLVGLWRFRRVKEKTPQWCCTWRYKGNYYDTFPRKTPEAALKAMLKNWTACKARNSNGR
jgi:hypothetical protein